MVFVMEKNDRTCVIQLTDAVLFGRNVAEIFHINMSDVGLVSRS